MLIEHRPAARLGDPCLCVPVAKRPSIGSGSATVLIGGQKAARIGDMVCHGGVIVTGSSTVHIGDSGAGRSSAMTRARTAASPFVKMDRDTT